jgi:hypothetical protein
MTSSAFRFVRLCAGAAVLLLLTASWGQPPQGPDNPAHGNAGPSPCDVLPKGDLSDDDLRRLVPDDSPGRVFIRWRTESQDDNYGFNIYRSEQADGPYTKINAYIIPGEGSTNIPKDYCYMDKPVPRGKVFYYYIESVSNQGVAEKVEGTYGTRVQVKTVEEERVWLRKKAKGEDVRTTATASAKGPGEQTTASKPAQKTGTTVTRTLAPAAAVSPTQQNKQPDPSASLH